jgi:hypothetical protein
LIPAGLLVTVPFPFRLIFSRKDGTPHPQEVRKRKKPIKRRSG